MSAGRARTVSSRAARVEQSKLPPFENGVKTGAEQAQGSTFLHYL